MMGTQIIEDDINNPDEQSRCNKFIRMMDQWQQQIREASKPPSDLTKYIAHQDNQRMSDIAKMAASAYEDYRNNPPQTTTAGHTARGWFESILNGEHD